MKIKVAHCPTGEEEFERFYSYALRAYRYQYDYRGLDGSLFSCVAKSVAEARERRDGWLMHRKAKVL